MWGDESWATLHSVNTESNIQNLLERGCMCTIQLCKLVNGLLDMRNYKPCKLFCKQMFCSSRNPAETSQLYISMFTFRWEKQKQQNYWDVIETICVTVTFDNIITEMWVGYSGEMDKIAEFSINRYEESFERTLSMI